MRFYEDLDELEDRIRVTDSREWYMEEEAVRQWFHDNPRLEELIPPIGWCGIEGQIEITLDDWPDYVDFDD